MIRFPSLFAMLILSAHFACAQLDPASKGQSSDTPCSIVCRQGLAGSMAPAADAEIVRAGEKKSANIALGLSLIVPGAGQVYNGEPVKGIVFLGLFTGGVALVDAARITREHRSITAFGWLSIVYVTAVYAWNVLDAPLSAAAINQAPDAGGDGTTTGRRLDERPLISEIRARDVIFRIDIGL